MTIEPNSFSAHEHHKREKQGHIYVCYLVGLREDGTLETGAHTPDIEPWYLCEYWGDGNYGVEFEFITNGEVYYNIEIRIWRAKEAKKVSTHSPGICLPGEEPIFGVCLPDVEEGGIPRLTEEDRKVILNLIEQFVDSSLGH